MLNDNKLNQFFSRWQLSEEARAIINRIRASPPVRRVKGSDGNVVVRYTSHKMGVVIQAESYKNEFAAVSEFENDDEVFEFYDQPSRMKLTYRSANGRPVGVWHTPDYFVIGRDRAGWVECKTAEELEQLAQKMPNRYVPDGEQGWRCPPGEQYAQPLGLFYRVRSSAETNWGFHRNATFLDDYWRVDPAELVVDRVAEAEILAAVIGEPGLSLGRLLAQLRSAQSDDVYIMLVKGQIFVDLRAYPLTERERVSVFQDQWTARAYGLAAKTVAKREESRGPRVSLVVGELLTWAGRPWRILNLTETQVWLRFEGDGEPGNLVKLSPADIESLLDAGELAGLPAAAEVEMNAEAREILAQASPTALQKANERYRLIVEPVLRGQAPVDAAVHPRSASRYVARFKQAQLAYQCGYVGLLDQTHKQGNRLPKIPAETRQLMLKQIAEAYESSKQPTKSAVYHSFRLACERQGLQPCSPKTFNQMITRRPREEQIRKRQGRKAATQQAAFYWELNYTTPRHGERAYELAHIDHTQINLELLHSETLKNLGRCWVTFLIDAFSRFLLALYLSYDPPSYRSCMMVLRDCVRRHHRLPQMIVNDGGSEFHSIYYETLLARYECSQRERPAGKPRFGTVIERLFGTSQSQFIYNLTGNTQLMLGDVRQVSREVNPKNLANWTLPRLYPRFCQWAELYNNAEHAALGRSPQEVLTASLALTGERRHRLMPYNQDFIIDTMPSTRKGTAKVALNRGVKINYLYYWHDIFRHPEVENRQVPVRYDPFNIGLAYVHVLGRWTPCISEQYLRLRDRSERILKLAAEELRARNRRHVRQLPLTGRWLAEFIEELEREEQYYELFWREGDNQRVNMLAEGGQLASGATELPPASVVTMAPDPVNLNDEPAEAEPEADLAAYPVFTL